MTVSFLFPPKSLFIESISFPLLQGIIYSIFYYAHCWMSKDELSPPIRSKNTATLVHSDYKSTLPNKQHGHSHAAWK